MLIAAPLVALVVSAAGVWAGFQYTLPISPLVAILFTLLFSLSVILSLKRRVTSNKS
jgi:zinc/manganese transport system permease protein